MLDQLGPIAIIGVVLGAVYLAGGRGAQATQSAFEGYFRGYQPDPWPRGVQEQDIARHWDAGDRGRADRSGASAPDARARTRPEDEPAEVWTLMRPPRIPIQPIREFRLESHV